MDSELINVTVSAVLCDALEKTFENLEEKFAHDFDARFGGCAIIEENRPFCHQNRTCSKNQIRAWIDQWISENGDLTNEFKLKANAFLENQFKRAQS
jgi:hypothetical protein